MAMRVVFCGTPDFAMPSLRVLVDAGFEVPLVVSQPDKKRGRGRQLSPTPVRALAQEMGLATTTLERGQRNALYERILSLDPDVVVVVAFGHIIREPLLNGARFGCVNVHASSLPRWRGPAPIHRAIVGGDTHTGVCTMQLAAGVDTGDVYLCEETAIGENETTGELHDRLADMGAALLPPTLHGLAAGSLVGTPQDESQATHAPMLAKQEGSVDFRATAATVHDRIRGLDPWPSVTVMHEGRRLRLLGSRRGEAGGGEPGEILQLDERGMQIACATQSIWVTRLQPEGRRVMPAADYARGAAIEVGQRLEPLPDFGVTTS